ncbi:MAG: NUMOD3 domain-containing DNA-binding protein [Halobellus sp.]|uniref:NUMOD3 domain-containing DNA-binding protein n=1 Tax=Halobellus sp. TaxID=1979212 RepID=UPI0035D4D805
MSADEDDGFWKGLETELGEDELQAALEEADDDEVVCRECAAAFGQITEQHLGTHGKTLDAYIEEHPDAPIYPEAPERQPGREEGYKHSEETIRRISESMTDGDDA